MNFFSIINEFDNFSELKKTLKKKYNLQVKEKDNLYIVNIKKNKINENPDLNLCNGIILEKNTNKVVCNIYPVVKEYPDTYQYNDFSSVVVEEAIDGTLIKLFYYNNKWNVATNRCIDASDAFWICNKSFYDLFMEAATKLNLNMDNLNKSYSYGFILQHPRSRNVKKYEVPNLVYVYSFDNVNNVQIVDNNLEGINVPKRYQFSTWEEMMSSITTLNYDIEGYIIYNNKKEITKVVNPTFKLVKEMKGNTPDMVYRCLVLYKLGKMESFLKYYPEYTQNFNYIKSFMYNLVNKFFMLYITRYVKKQPLSVPPHYELILNHLHKDYLESNNDNMLLPKKKVTKKTIHAKLMGYSPLRIYSFFGSN